MSKKEIKLDSLDESNAIDKKDPSNAKSSSNAVFNEKNVNANKNENITNNSDHNHNNVQLQPSSGIENHKQKKETVVSNYRIVEKNFQEPMMKEYETIEDYENRFDKPTTRLKAFRIFNGVMKYIFLVILVLLVNGSIVIGGLSIKYPPRGIITEIPLNDLTDRKIKIHYLCDGPVDDKNPFFLFEGSASHGLLDYVGVQLELKKLNRSSCIWDKAGLGYSDYMLYNSTLDSYYHNFISSLNKNRPYVFIGWGDGSGTIYKYALKYPEMVKALVFLDGSLEGEFTSKKIVRGWNESYYLSYRTQELESRYGLFRIINGLGVPLGLMSIFIGGDKNVVSFPKDSVEEKDWYMITDKTWRTQYNYFILNILNNVEDPDFRKIIDSRIAIHSIFTALSDDIIKSNCVKENYNENSEECKYRVLENQYSINKKINITKLNPGGKAIKCSDAKCNLGTYILTDPKYTADRLVELFPSS